ncbi:uncharacterized protein LOC106666927 [Cimex lectularius]|uniref:Uncharacterized protein n=1 Tax=Cimex lectularius TaxID=79782 RepID=A0A8I6TEN3_CIMLE|nr:uncharacterized protein LOC106666927 [Cimex lectularius]
MADDEFNELWMFKNKKASVAAYRSIHPCQYVYKRPDSNLTKFLISLGERIYPRKSSSLESEEVADKKESVRTSSPSDTGSPYRTSLKKSSTESRRFSNTKKSSTDFRRHSITKKSSDDIKGIDIENKLSSDSRRITAKKPLDRKSHGTKRPSFESARLSDVDCRPIEEIYRHAKDRSPTKRCGSPGRAIYSPRKSISPLDRASSPQGKGGSPGKDGSLLDKEGSPGRIGSPRSSWCPSGKAESPRKNSRSPTGTISTKSRSLSLTDEISRYYHRKRKLVGSMPGLDEFESLDSIDFSITELRFADPNVHTVFEKVQPTIKGVEESVVPVQHDFKLKVIQLKHDNDDNVYFGVIDSEEESEESDEESVITENEELVLSDSSNEEHPSPNHYYYKKFNIPTYKKNVFIAENHYSEWLKEQSIKNYRQLFNIKEKSHCKYDTEHNLEEKKKEMFTKNKQTNQGEGYTNLRNQHDLKYKYIPVIARCDRIAGRDLDELYLAELTLALREAQKAALRGQGVKRETPKQKKMLAKLMKIFKYETDSPMLSCTTASASHTKLKAKEKIINRRFEAKQESLTTFKEQIHNYLFNRIYSEGLDDFYEEELNKRDAGLMMDPDDKFSYSSLLYEPRYEEPKRYHSYLYRRLIVGRDFSNVPSKTIKGLENLGILYESTLYDPPKDGMYRGKPIVEVKKNFDSLPSMKTGFPKRKAKKSILIHLEPETDDANTPSSPQPSKKKKIVGGLKSHRDSLKKKQKPKKMKGEKGDKDADGKPLNKDKSRSDEDNSKLSENIKPSENGTDKINLEAAGSMENLTKGNDKTVLKGSPEKVIPEVQRKSIKILSPLKKKSIYDDRQDVIGSEEIHKLKSALKGSPSPDKKMSFYKNKNKSVDGSFKGLPMDMDRSSRPERPKNFTDKMRAAVSQEVKPPIIIEFDPVANGAITKSMEQFATYYNTPLNEMSRLADGVILIEPDEKRIETKLRKSTTRRQTEESQFSKSSPRRSDDSVSMKRSIMSKD